MSDTKLDSLVINELTKAQYDALTPEANQLYLVTDEVPLDSSALIPYRTSANQDVIDATKANSADLSAVATSGDYDDLSNKPTIPTVPTNVSAFTNDAGYLTQHQSLSGYATEAWVGQQGFLTSHQDISGKENTSNKVTAISSSSTDTQYPSAKCVYDIVGNIETLLEALL